MNPVLLGGTGRRIEYDNLVVGVGQRGGPRQRVMSDQRESARPAVQAAEAAVDVGADGENRAAGGLGVRQNGEWALAAAVENRPGTWRGGGRRPGGVPGVEVGFGERRG